jgi:hypothetical protein
MAIELRLSKEAHGQEIARLQQTVSTLQDLLKFCDSTQVLKEAVKMLNNKNGRDDETSPMAAAAATIQPEAEGLLRLAKDRLTAAEDDNRNVYLVDVPKASELPEIRAQMMVKTDLPLSDAMLTPRANLFQWTRRR